MLSDSLMAALSMERHKYKIHLETASSLEVIVSNGKTQE